MIGIDQYGNVHQIPGIYPRKELMESCYAKHAEKVYVDTKDGECKHIGYIVNGLWIKLYEEWKGGKV